MLFPEISSDPNKDIFLFVFYAKGMKTVLNFLPKKIDFCMKRAEKGSWPQGYRNSRPIGRNFCRNFYYRQNSKILKKGIESAFGTSKHICLGFYGFVRTYFITQTCFEGHIFEVIWKSSRNTVQMWDHFPFWSRMAILERKKNSRNWKSKDFLRT